ncbi:hypothetical protein JCM11641_005328 [Rhodosporidiobolus odoratus]
MLVTTVSTEYRILPSFDRPYTYLITGASRSLGLGYAEKLLAASPEVRVVVAVRNPAKADQVQALANKPENKDRVLIVEFDVEREESVKAAAEKLASHPFLENGLDALIANAGVFCGLHTTPSQLGLDDLDANFRVNVYGVIHTVTHLLPLLKKGQGKQIFVLSSIVTSFGGPFCQMPGAVTYSMSKAAVQMYTVKLARELGPEGFTVIPFHPGYGELPFPSFILSGASPLESRLENLSRIRLSYLDPDWLDPSLPPAVKTDMNHDGGGEIETEEAVTLAAKNVLLAATPADNCRFMSYNGTDLPW